MFPVNCWPSENNSGGCDVNIEYELEDDSLELRDVEITIPVPSGSGAPVMNECTGEYEYDKRKGALVWRLPGTTKTSKTISTSTSLNNLSSCNKQYSGTSFYPTLKLRLFAYVGSILL